MEQNVPFPQRRALNCDFEHKPKHADRHKTAQWWGKKKLKLVKTGTKIQKWNQKENTIHAVNQLSKLYRWIKRGKIQIVGISQFSKAKSIHSAHAPPRNLWQGFTTFSMSRNSFRTFKNNNEIKCCEENGGA